jgi:phage shock protein A
MKKRRAGRAVLEIALTDERGEELARLAKKVDRTYSRFADELDALAKTVAQLHQRLDRLEAQHPPGHGVHLTELFP